MAQRYFLTAESTYEDLRQYLNTQLKYPNSLGKSIFQTALQAPRDNYRRILLAVDTSIANYDTVNAAIAPLLDSDAMEEVDEATYLAAVASATAGVASWTDITGTPTTLAGYGITDAAALVHAHSATSGEITGLAAVATSGSAADLTGTLNAARLPATTVTAGSYGSASIVATFTVDAAGRLTAAGSTSIAITSAQVSGLGTLATQSGTFSGTSSGTNTGDQTIVLQGDVTGSGTGTFTATIASNAVTTSKIANAAVTVAKISATGTASGTTFLRGDGTWASAGSTSASDLTSGTLAYARMADPTVTSPSQIAANQNDYASFARGINRFTTDAARDITGMTAGSDGEVRVLTNVGTTAANTLTIKDESSSSTAANRFTVPWGGDCVIPAKGSVVVYYDGTSSRWRVV